MRRHVILFTMILMCSFFPRSMNAADTDQAALNARSVEAYGKLPLAFVEKAPGIYQENNGDKIPVKGGYKLSDDGVINFNTDAYNLSLPLVVDPASDLNYSAFLGGSGNDYANSIAIDSSGCAYVAGQTYSTDFPTTPGAFDTALNGDSDAFVTKLSPSGSAILYSTFLGGGGNDRANSIAVDSSGCVYASGRTWSSDFPTTLGAFDTTLNDSNDAFVTKLNPSGSDLIYSTYLGGSGGSESASSVVLDSSGCAYVAGYTWSSNFPTTPGSFDTTFNGGSSDAFVTKLNSSGSALIYSTFLGGNGDYDSARSIVVDSSSCAYVAGATWSTNFPTTAGAFDTTFNGSYYDAFVTKLNQFGSGLIYSTFLGGSGGADASSITVDSSGCVYTAGVTWASDFPTTLGAFDTTYNGGVSYGDAFVTKLNSSGSALIYSTFLGEGNDDYANSIAVDSAGYVHVAGWTTSSDFPTTPNAFDTTYNGGANGDAFVTKINPSGSDLIYSTFFGGSGNDTAISIAVASSGSVYVAGSTESSDLPTTPDAFDTTLNGAANVDAFVTKLKISINPILAGLGSDGSVWYTEDMNVWKSIPGGLSTLSLGDFNGDGSSDISVFHRLKL